MEVELVHFWRKKVSEFKKTIILYFNVSKHPKQLRKNMFFSVCSEHLDDHPQHLKYRTDDFNYFFCYIVISIVQVSVLVLFLKHYTKYLLFWRNSAHSLHLLFNWMEISQKTFGWLLSVVHTSVWFMVRKRWGLAKKSKIAWSFRFF